MVARDVVEPPTPLNSSALDILVGLDAFYRVGSMARGERVDHSDDEVCNQRVHKDCHERTPVDRGPLDALRAEERVERRHEVTRHLVYPLREPGLGICAEQQEHEPYEDEQLDQPEDEHHHARQYRSEGCAGTPMIDASATSGRHVVLQSIVRSRPKETCERFLSQYLYPR